MEDRKALNRLIKEMAESVSNETDIARSYLKSQGVDSDELIEAGGALIRRIQFLRKAEYNERKDKVLEERAWNRIVRIAKEKAISELEAIKLLVPNLEGTPALYSKLENLSENDLKNALQEEGLLKLMERLDNDKEDDQ